MPTRGLINPELLTDIADAIRAKNGTSAGMTPAQMAEAISNLELSEAIKQALLNCFAHVAWIDDQGQSYYDALEDALYPTAPPAELLSISAVFEQGQTVIYDTDSLDDLKPMLTVTAHYSDGTSAEVTTYTLSGTLTVGTTSTITVSYGGKTTTFDVVVSNLHDVTPDLSTVVSADTSKNAATYNSETDTLRVYTLSGKTGTYLQARVNFTFRTGYKYRAVFDGVVSSGTGLLAIQSRTSASLLKTSGTFTTNEQKTLDFDPAEYSALTNNQARFAFFCTYSTASAGDVSYKNFRLFEYLEE